MKNFLLIEDDSNKSKQIIEYLQEIVPNSGIVLKKSYQSGLKELFSKSYDKVFLDMQLPTFDISSGEDGYRFRKLAGMDIMNELIRKNVNCEVIIVTQFETFGEGENYMELSDLRKKLAISFKKIYVDTVFYNASQSLWKHELKKLITKG